MFVGPCHHSMASTQVADGGTASDMGGVAANKLNKQSRTADKGWSSSLGVEGGANHASPWKKNMLRNTHRQDASSGDKTIWR